MRSRSGSDPVVRPRRVWAGTALAVSGVVVAGVGAAVPTTWLVVPGAALLLLGGVVALRAGVLHDVRVGSPGQELATVAEGGPRPATPTSPPPRARERAVGVSRRLRALQAPVRHAQGPGSVRPAGAVLLLTAAVLVAAQWGLYPPEDPGQSNALRALGCAVLLGLVGLRFCTVQPGRVHRVASGLAATGGVLLVVNALVAAHAHRGTVGLEFAAGAVALLAAAATVVVEPARARHTP